MSDAFTPKEGVPLGQDVSPEDQLKNNVHSIRVDLYNIHTDVRVIRKWVQFFGFLVIAVLLWTAIRWLINYQIELGNERRGGYPSFQIDK